MTCSTPYAREIAVSAAANGYDFPQGRPWPDLAGLSGLARSTINRGEVDNDAEPPGKGRIADAGGEGKAVIQNDPALLPEQKRLTERATLGDTMRPLIWS